MRLVVKYVFFFIAYNSIFPTVIEWGTESSPFTPLKIENLNITSKNKDEMIQMTEHSYQLTDEEELNSYRITFDYEQKNLPHIVAGIIKSEYVSRVLPGAFSRVASFEMPEHQIVINPPKYLFLNEKEQIDSFSILFLVHPYVITESSKVFEKIAFIHGKKYGLSCFLRDSRITFEFYNLFWYEKDESIPLVTMQAKERVSSLSLDKVALLYDAKDGSLKLYLNQKEQAILYITNTGKEDGSPLWMKNHPLVSSLLIIGRDFKGALDEFIFSNHILPLKPEAFTYGSLKSYNTLFVQRSASFLSKRYSLPHSQSELFHFILEAEQPEGTKIDFYIRYSNLPFVEATNEFEMPFQKLDVIYKSDSIQKLAWYNTSSIRGRGKYFQWKFVLYPDSLGTKTPKMAQIKFMYQDNPPPSAPQGFQLLQKNADELVFVLNRNPENDVLNGGRYHIYYGIEPYKALGVIRYKSITNTMKVTMNDSDKVDTSDIHFKNKLRIVVNNDIISQNFIYTKDKPHLFNTYPAIQSNIPMYFWVTVCDNMYSEIPELMDHESKPSKTIVVRP